jgi:hypothetical protein
MADQAPSNSNRAWRGPCRRSFLAGGLAAIAASIWPRTDLSSAESDAADTSAEARADATRRLPLSELTAETRRKIMAVVESPTIFRRLPQRAFDCDPEMYLFLIRNPEVVVNIWQVMGVANMTAERLGAYAWKGKDGTGTECDVELVYGTDEMHVIYSDGFYEGPLIRRKITGRAVMVMQTGYAQAQDRRWQIGNRLDLFLQLDNAGLDLVARTLSPWVGKVADSNFAESCKFASKLSLTAEQNAAGMQRLAGKLTSCEQQVRDEFARVSVGVEQRAALRNVAASQPVRRG